MCYLHGRELHVGDTAIDRVMKAYASEAVEVAARCEVVLDYSEESLAAVDQLLAQESFIGPTPRTPESPEDDERLWSLSKTLGAYVGEVAIRVCGGQWVGDPTPGGGTRPAIETNGLKGFPVDKVWKRLTESELDGVGGYCRALRAIAAHAKGGR